jgi:hypothetical protein
VTKEDSESKKNYSNSHPIENNKLLTPVENNKLSIKEIIVEGHKDLVKKYKTKAKNIWGGMKIVAGKIKGN